MRPRIHELLERWFESLNRVYGLSPQRYLQRFYAETKFEEALRMHTPQILEEVRGIAEGADADYRTVLALQHVNEEFWLALPPPEAIAEACSTIALGRTPDQATLIGQNLDLDIYLDGYQVLLRYNCDRSDGHVLALTVPGMISLNGMNSHGFAVCDNALTQLRGDIAGVPIFAIYRELLESRSLAEAQATVARLPHASGLNWVMGDPDAVLMLESSAGGVMKYGPHDPARPIYHTNHPLVSADLSPQARGKTSRPTRSTYLRYAALHEQISVLPPTLSIDAIKSVLSSCRDPDYPVSRGGGRNEEDEAIGFTLACCIFELVRGAPKFHIASGPRTGPAFGLSTPDAAAPACLERIADSRGLMCPRSSRKPWWNLCP